MLAEQWLADYLAADIGIEGLVSKALREPYPAGRRTWRKLRARSTHDAIIGAVTGLAHPGRLVLGLPGTGGLLVVAGSTAPVPSAIARTLTPHLYAPAADHPWPNLLPSGRLGLFGGPRVTPVTLVEPTLVVEVSADSAFEHHRWRHLVRVVRARPDLPVAEVVAPRHHPPAATEQLHHVDVTDPRNHLQ